MILHSLPKFGITGPLVQLIEDNLRNRNQRVVIDDHLYDEIPVTSGVPQGSVIGPLLFIMAVNDLHKHLNCELDQYADDIAISHEICTK